MKGILTVILMIAVAGAVSGQSNHQFLLGVDAGLGIPLNNVSNDYGTTRTYYQDGISIDLKAEMPVFSSLHFIVSAGYAYYPSNLHYNYFTLSSYDPAQMPDIAPPPANNLAFAFTPLQTGFKFYFVKHLYVEADAGAAIAAKSSSNTSFIYTGQAGAMIPLSKRSDLNLSFGFESGFKVHDFPYAMSQLGFKVGYSFGL